MTLQTSGAITLADIQTEFGGANPISLSEYYAGGGLVPAGTGSIPSSGLISLNSFYGTSAVPPSWRLNNSMSSGTSTGWGIESSWYKPSYTWNNNRGTGNLYYMTKPATTSASQGVIVIGSTGSVITQFITTYISPGQIGNDSSGNIYLFGYMYVGANYVAIAKYNSSGTIQWAKRILGTSYDWAYGPMIVNTDSIYGISHVNGTNLVKYSQSGVLQWIKDIKNIYNSQNRVNATAATDDGNIIVAGYDNGTSTSYDNTLFAMFIAKIGYSTGNIMWSRRLLLSVANTNGHAYSSIDTDSSSNIYATGYYGFGTGSYTGVPYIVKYDTNGVLQWQRKITGTGLLSFIPQSLSASRNGNIYVVLRVYYNSSFDNYYIIVKYNSSGVLQWQRKIIYTNASGTYYTLNISGIASVEDDSKFIINGYKYYSSANSPLYTDSVYIKLPSDGSKTGTLQSSPNLTYSISTIAVDAIGTGTDQDYTSSSLTSSSSLVDSDFPYLPTTTPISGTNSTVII